MSSFLRLLYVLQNLDDGNRQLILSQDAAVLRSTEDHVPHCHRAYEHVSDVSLFLFNDMLVVTQRRVQHTPFTLDPKSTHTLLASVALTSLRGRPIEQTCYASHAFILQGPHHSWVCATERGDQSHHDDGHVLIA